ncbi:unnamed protein product [Cochlearia groenlandica]
MAHQQRLGPKGSRLGGIPFDDVHDGVEKVTVGLEAGRIVSLEVEYDHHGHSIRVVHGEAPRGVVVFGPLGTRQSGYIKEVGGTYVPGTLRIPCGYISSLYFVTSRGVRHTFGVATKDFDEIKFSMTGARGKRLVGLYGRFGNNSLISIGATFAP